MSFTQPVVDSLMLPSPVLEYILEYMEYIPAKYSGKSISHFSDLILVNFHFVFPSSCYKRNAKRGVIYSQITDKPELSGGPAR